MYMYNIYVYIYIYLYICIYILYKYTHYTQNIKTINPQRYQSACCAEAADAAKSGDPRSLYQDPAGPVDSVQLVYKWRKKHGLW